MDSESQRILKDRAEDLVRKQKLSDEMGQQEHRRLMVRNGVIGASDEAWEVYKQQKGWSHASETGIGSEVRSTEVQVEPPQGDPEPRSTGSSHRPKKVRKNQVPKSSDEREIA